MLQWRRALVPQRHTLFTSTKFRSQAESGLAKTVCLW